LFLAGIIILVKSADYFIESIVSMAKWFGISEFFIGLTVVSIGTSLPELGTAFMSLIYNKPELIVGNVIGANILDMSIVIAIAAMITNLIVQRDIINYDLPALLAVSFLFWIFMSDGYITWLEGILFVVVYIGYVLMVGEERVEISHGKVFERRKTFFLFLSFIGLLLGAEMVVNSASDITNFLGISTTVFGLTLVSIGTTLPELTTSVMSAWKGEKELALGNITGSVLFNLCIILGISSIFTPIPIVEIVSSISFPIMVGLVIILGIMAMDKEITKFDALVLLAIYISFLSLIV